MEEDKIIQKKRSNVTLFSVFCTISAAIGSLLYGYDTGVIAGALLYIVPEFRLEDKPFLEGTIVSITLFGALIGSLIGGKFSDVKGRKQPLFLCSIIFIIGGGLMFWSPSVGVLIGGRGMVGLAIGISGVVIPILISESAPANSRGTLAVFPQLFISIGILSSYLVDLGISLSESSSWRLMLGVSIFPAIIQFILIFGLPESPRWLVMKNRNDEAKNVLMKLRNDQHVEEELEVITQGITNMNTTSLKWSDFSAPGIPKIFLAGCGLQFFQQLSGINAIIYYTPTILIDSGIEDLFKGLSKESASILGTILVYIPKIPSLFLTMWLIDKIGRRKLLLSTIPTLSLCLAGLAITSYLSERGDGEDNSVFAIASMICILFYGCFFVAGLGAIPNIYCSEIFPPHLRAIGFGICVGVQWVLNIGVSQLFPVMRQTIGLPITFGIFMLSCIFGTFFVYFFIPETKGKSLEQTIPSINNLGK